MAIEERSISVNSWNRPFLKGGRRMSKKAVSGMLLGTDFDVGVVIDLCDLQARTLNRFYGDMCSAFVMWKLL
jgi:hypothetical protein